ncbi:MAG TPA: hypothetical protein VKT77_20895 [Chthonomonadaceae bacterium]|nr:hypothetical protein [Chthonomonadaceae bacterium]
MRTRLSILAAGLLALCALATAGCGGGGAPATGSARGTVSVGLQFQPRPAAPSKASGKTTVARTRQAFAGNIPFGALSVTVSLTNPSTGAALAPTRVVTAPFDTGGNLLPLITVQFASLPIGPVRVDVAAFPTVSATGNVLATGTATGTILPAQTITLTAPMVMRVVRVVVNPPQLSINQDGDMAQISGNALDANNQPLDLPLFFVSSDPDLASVAPTSGGSNQATVSTPVGGSSGTTQITVYEPNSQISATLPVTIR